MINKFYIYIYFFQNINVFGDISFILVSCTPIAFIINSVLRCAHFSFGYFPVKFTSGSNLVLIYACFLKVIYGIISKHFWKGNSLLFDDGSIVLVIL